MRETVECSRQAAPFISLRTPCIDRIWVGGCVMYVSQSVDQGRQAGRVRCGVMWMDTD